MSPSHHHQHYLQDHHSLQGAAHVTRRSRLASPPRKWAARSLGCDAPLRLHSGESSKGGRRDLLRREGGGGTSAAEEGVQAVI